MTIKASIIADSVNPTGNRLTTYLLYYPRCIHSEVMTHRAFSRNSASSRAIPIERMIQRVRDDPFIPKWSAAQPGMTVTNEIDVELQEAAKIEWLRALEDQVNVVQNLASMKLAKSVVNRLLEPWMHIEVVLSATEFNNFFTLRDDPAAEPHIRELANMMREIRNNSEPVHRDGQSFLCETPTTTQEWASKVTGDMVAAQWWHMPFIKNSQRSRSTVSTVKLSDLIKESVAHAAWVSYGNVGGKPGFTQEDVDRVYSKLVGSQPIHASPTEHVAVACNGPHRHGNFVGWCQWRQFLPNQTGGDYNV